MAATERRHCFGAAGNMSSKRNGAGRNGDHIAPEP
jgi:hypothetical protein